LSLPFPERYWETNTSDIFRITKHIDTLFLITHKSTFNISLQALVLIQHICTSLSPSSTVSTGANDSAHPLVDRFYLTLYASLHDPRLASTSKQAMYLNLVFKSIKQDPSPSRQMAFVRRFTQVLVAGSGGAAVEWIVGGLFLLGEVKFFSAGC
jgi:ribosome biogenesis protein MAK21